MDGVVNFGDAMSMMAAWSWSQPRECQDLRESWCAERRCPLPERLRLRLALAADLLISQTMRLTSLLGTLGFTAISVN